MATKASTLNDIVEFIKDPVPQKDKKRSSALQSIEDHSLLGPVHCDRAAEYLQVNYKASDAAQAQALSFKASSIISTHDAKVALKTRRAYVLLHAMIAKDLGGTSRSFNEMPAGQMDIKDNVARENLKRLVRIAATLRDGQTESVSSESVTSEALKNLLQDPPAFLNQSALLISVPVDKKMKSDEENKKGDDEQGARNQKGKQREETDNDQYARNQRDFYFGYNIEKLRYDIRYIPAKGFEVMKADGVPARPWNEVSVTVGAGSKARADFSKMPWIELGERVMVTSQITGCFFVMKREQGKAYCAHIKPSQDKNGKTLGEEIRSSVAFSNDRRDRLAIYGKGYSYGTGPKDNGEGYDSKREYGLYLYITVFGVRQNGGDYHIFAQEVKDVNNVVNVRQIF